MGDFAGASPSGGSKGSGIPDLYVQQRIDRTQKALQSSGYGADVIHALALSPLSDKDLDGGIKALGGDPGEGFQFHKILDQVSQGGYAQGLLPSHISSLKQSLIDNGWVHPSQQVDDVWRPDDAFSQGYKNAQQFVVQKIGEGYHPLSLAFRAGMGYLGNLTPTKVTQAIHGTLQNLVDNFGATAGHIGTALERAPGTVAAAFGGNLDEYRKQTRDLMGEDGKPYDAGSFINDAVNLASLIPFGELGKGAQAIGAAGEAADAAAQAGVRSHGVIRAVANKVANIGEKTGLSDVQAAAAEGAAKRAGLGASESGVDAAAEAARVSSPVADPVMQSTQDAINSFRPGGYKGMAQRLVDVADKTAQLKATYPGQILTAINRSATRFALQERSLGAIASGDIAPGVHLEGMKQSDLSRTIDASPVLGKSWDYHVFGLDKPFGNPLDLSMFLFNPSIKAPKLGEVANAAGNLVDYSDVAPLARLARAAGDTTISKEFLVDQAGGEANLSRLNLFDRAQAAAKQDAAEAMRGKSIDETSFRNEIWKAEGRYRKDLANGGDLVYRKAAQVSDHALFEHLQDIYKDYPETLGARGQGGPVDFGARANALDALAKIDYADMTVAPIKSGQALWAQVPGNAEALDASAEEMAQGLVQPGDSMTPDAGDIGGDIKARLAMKNRLLEMQPAKGTLVYAKSDNPLVGAQEILPLAKEADRLNKVKDFFETFTDRAYTASADSPEGPIATPIGKYTRMADIKAAGIPTEELMVKPEYSGTKPIPADLQHLTIDQANQLKQSVTARLGELTNKANNHLFAGNFEGDDQALIKATYKRGYEAGRLVNLADEGLQGDLAQAGLKPILINQDALTLAHIDPANAVNSLDAAQHLRKATDWLGTTADKLVGAGEKVRDGAKPSERVGLQTANLHRELEQWSQSNGLDFTSKDLMGHMAEMRNEIQESSRFTKLGGLVNWQSRPISDLRQFRAGDFMDKLGVTYPQAVDLQAAIRRGAAFGADITHPLQTARNLGQAIGLNGIPGIEDYLRTLVGAHDALPFSGTKIGSKVGKNLLNIPDELVRARDFLQYQMNPFFSAKKALKNRVLRGAEGLPIEFPFQTRSTLEKIRAANPDEFDTVIKKSLGDFTADPFLENMQDARTKLGGASNIDIRAKDAWNLYARQAAKGATVDDADYQAIKGTLNKIYGYPNRLALEKSANYIFFPLSFDMKLGKAVANWYIQQPSRVLMTQWGMHMYDQAKQDLGLQQKMDQYLPILHELNKLNAFGHGLGVTTGGLGGRNKLISNGFDSLVNALSSDPKLGAFIPQAFTSADYRKGNDLLSNLAPLFKEIKTFGDALGSQLHALPPIVGGQGGGDHWQISNYFAEKRALDDQVSNKLSEVGVPLSGLASSKKVDDSFKQLVNSEYQKLIIKYPSGADYAKQLRNDLADRNQELLTMRNQDAHSPTQNAVLYFDAQLSKAEIEAHQRGLLTRSKINGKMSRVDNTFDPQEADRLRALAVQLVKIYPQFGPAYRRYFEYNLGPITAPQTTAARTAA